MLRGFTAEANHLFLGGFRLQQRVVNQRGQILLRCERLLREGLRVKPGNFLFLFLIDEVNRCHGGKLLSARR